MTQDNFEGEVMRDLSPCCWKIIGRADEYLIAERICDKTCDHDHHDTENQDGWREAFIAKEA